MSCVFVFFYGCFGICGYIGGGFYIYLWLVCYELCIPHRVRQAKRHGKGVIHVDGSYFYRKREQLKASGITCAPLPLPTFPPLGWTLIIDSNQRDVKLTMPVVYPTTL